MHQQGDELTKERLNAAANAIKMGKVGQGKALLEGILKEEPDNILAHLWMTKCTNDPAIQLRHFELVRELDPDNPHAAKGIAWLKARLRQSPPRPPKSPIPAHTDTSGARAKVKTCPYCGEEIKAEAIVCRFCGRDLKEHEKKAKARKLRGPLLVALAVVLGACICISTFQSIFAPGSSTSSENPASSNPWVPSGFTRLNGETAYRLVTGKKCSLGTIAGCAHYEVFTRYGCPTSLYVEVAFFDSNGTQVDWSNDTASTLQPGEKALLEFVSFDNSAEKVRITDVSCY